MLSYLIRRALGPGGGGFWGGLVMVLAGIALTVFSATISEALGLPISFVFYGLIVVGLVRMAAGLPALFRGGGRRQQMTGGPTSFSYYSPPMQATPGYCWECGGRVKRGATICLHCGATQAGEKEESEVAAASGFGHSDGAGMIPTPANMPAANAPRWSNNGDPGYGGQGGYPGGQGGYPGGQGGYPGGQGGYPGGQGGYPGGQGGYGPQGGYPGEQGGYPGGYPGGYGPQRGAGAYGGAPARGGKGRGHGRAKAQRDSWS